MSKNLHNRVNREVLLQKISVDPTPRVTASFYKYHKIGNPFLFRNHLYLMLDDLGVLGRIYVSYEGINAQISLPEFNKTAFRSKLNEITFLENCRLNYAIEDDGKSFFKLAIKVRDKIVADGLDDKSFDVTNHGIHVTAEQFNTLADDEETIIVDMRNHYESEVGYFKNAILPDVETFREELPLVEKLLEDKKDKKILMYCTGGIRCEKASSYLKHKGFKNVFQLDGGIIEYARQVRELNLDNKFVGKNFVFDERLGERVSNDVVAKCHQCGDACDDHKNCNNEACHILFIQCKKCAERFSNCCSMKCKDFNQLDLETKKSMIGKIIFNGTKFGKARYKANRANHDLESQ